MAGSRHPYLVGTRHRLPFDEGPDRAIQGEYGEMPLPRRAATDDASSVDGPEPARASPVPPEAARPAASGVGPPPSTIPMPTRTGRSGTLPQAVDGPPPPVEPEVITRDALNRATVRAVRLMTPLTLDGQLDEAVYTRVPAMSDFIQQEPLEGAPATERTDVWMFFDDERVYLSFRCWESEPERLIVNEMRRDNLVSLFEPELHRATVGLVRRRGECLAIHHLAVDHDRPGRHGSPTAGRSGCRCDERRRRRDRQRVISTLCREGS